MWSDSPDYHNGAPEPPSGTGLRVGERFGNLRCGEMGIGGSGYREGEL